MSSAEAEAELRAEATRKLLEGVKLENIAYSGLSMVRKDGEPPAPDAQFPVQLEMEVATRDEGVAYRVIVSVDRPDISASVSVVAIYRAQQPAAFENPELAREFGERIALLALYPYARAKMQEITIDAGVARPVVLDVVLINNLSLARIFRGVAGEPEFGAAVPLG